MKKILIFLALTVSLNCFSQKKDSVIMDTVFVFNVSDIQSLSEILMKSNINLNGKPATGQEYNQLIQWLYKHVQIFKKESPKK